MRWENDGRPREPTYVAHDASSRLDRIYCSAEILPNVENYMVSDDIPVPQHISVIIQVARRTTWHTMSTVLKELDLQTKRDDHDETVSLESARRQWEATNLLNLDEKYVEFIRFVKHAELLAYRTTSPVEFRSLWEQLAKRSKSVARSYGIPDMPDDLTQENIHRKMLLVVRDYDRKALNKEYEVSYLRTKQLYRERLHRHRGVNRHAAQKLKGHYFVKPEIKTEGALMDNPEDILKLAEEQWAQFYAVTPEALPEEWIVKYLAPLICAPFLH